MHLTDLSDEELVSSLRAICAEGHRLMARLVVHLGEVEQRSLHLKAACSSMFDYCTRKLGMSDGAAHRRINAARLVRRFPGLLERLERGEVHLSALASLAKHLTEANFEELIAAVSGKTMREVEYVIARYAPRPDVPATITELSPVTLAQPALLPITDTGAAPRQTRIEPLSEARYRVELTASTELRDKLERARDLMRHRNPSGDLAVVVERALDALLERLEKERLGKTARPQRTVRASKPGHVPQAVRREVFERDGEQCTFLDEDGHRCPSRTLLELDHVESRALGGSDEASNLRVRCRPHNLLHAEQVFGKEHVARHIDLRQRKAHRVTTDAKPACDAIDLATRGLVNLGFRVPDVRRVLDVVAERHRADGMIVPVQEILREALAVLT
jgi:5-methylcytosine-specific restriction endonuclease McrA